MDNSIAVIGSGASGLVASIFLAADGFDVTVFEKNSKSGKKLLATGNGRCNISNENISSNNFYSQNPQFINYLLKRFTYKDCKDFFNKLGIEFIINEKGRAYPMSLTASSVVDLLEYEALKKGVKFKFNSEITKIERSNGYFILNDNEKFEKVIVATGSGAMPKLGSSTSGYRFAQKFGHEIIEPFPSLVQLISSNKNLDIINGVKIEGEISGIAGDILFTKYGLSGSAVLDLSRDIAQRLLYEDSIEVYVDILPSFSKNKLIDMLQKRVKMDDSKDIFLWLDGFINKKLAKYIIINSNIPKTIKYVKDMGRKDLLKIAHTIKNLKFYITSTRGFDYCEVSAGGIDTAGIDEKTFESKLQRGIYFTGEVLDIDGDCGGYNLHFAWGSGYLAAEDIIKKGKR